MDIYGHRGASGHAPENTIAAYRMAFEKFDADGIEIDVHYSKDKELVVMHDFELSRTTNGDGLIFSKTLKELKELSAGVKFSRYYKNEKIPALSEVLELVSKYDKKINIELKAGSFFYPDIEQRIIKMIYDFGLEKKTLLSSFDHVSMVRAKEIDNTIATGILSASRMFKTAEYVLQTGADAYNVFFAALTPEDMAELRKAKLMVNCYAPNRPYEIIPMINLGVDILITNYPDVAKKLLHDSIQI